MPELLILADDLTGACDAAGPFADRGFETLVSLAPECWRGTARSCGEVVGWDLDLRDRPEAEAARRLAAALCRLPAAQVPRLYLKVDSTLRGPVAAMVGAVMAARGCRTALLAPAFPANGRILREGACFTPDTGYRRDVAEVLRPSGLPVRLVSRGDLRRGTLPEILRGAGKLQVVVPDVLEDADLGLVAEAALAAGGSCLPVGSAGLSGALARRMGRGSGGAGPRPAARLLIVVGSPHPSTLLQVETYLRAGGACTSWPPATEGPGDPAATTRMLHLRPTQGPSQEASPGDDPAEGRRLAERFARRAIEEAETFWPDALVLTGGATARAVLMALWARLRGQSEAGEATDAAPTEPSAWEPLSLRIHGDLLPGIPRATLVGPDTSQASWTQGLIVVTKSGGFGPPDTLLRLAKALRVGRLRAPDEGCRVPGASCDRPPGSGA